MARRPDQPTMTIFDTQIDVRTRRLRLRPPGESDADRLYALFNNWEVICWLDSPPWPYMPEHARFFIDARKEPHPDFITAAIVLDDALIGLIDAIRKPASAIQREPGFAVGYWIGQPYWGRGYMREAARGVVAPVLGVTSDRTTLQ